MADEQHTDWIASELRRAAVTERAPSHLRLHVDEMSRQRGRRPSGRLLFVPAVGVLAAVIVVLILALPGGTPGGPTVAQAAVLGARAVQPYPVTLSPTAEQSSTYFRLTGVHFPKWTTDGSWTFAGDSINVLDGRKILTVDYKRGSEIVAYSVAESPVLRGQKSGFTTFGIPQHTVVSWRAANHSCLLSSTTVPRSTLLKLAKG